MANVRVRHLTKKEKKLVEDQFWEFAIRTPIPRGWRRVFVFSADDVKKGPKAEIERTRGGK